MDSRLRGNDGGQRGNDGGGLRRRESIKYDTSFVGWAKRNVPNTQMLPFPRFVRLLVRIAKLPSPMFPHPIFQVAGYTCVEYSLGFVGHDVDCGLFHDRCTAMDSRLRGNDGESFAGMTGEACVGGNPWLLCSFSVITPRHSRVGGNPWLLFTFSVITLRHSRAGGNPSNTTAAPM